VKRLTEQDLMFQEPRKVFINLIIIPHMRFISEMLVSRPNKALAPMRALINNLDKFSHKQLQELYEELWQCELHSRRATRQHIEDLYRQLSVFLHSHYLKEYGVKPRHPKSDHIGEKEIDGH